MEVSFAELIAANIYLLLQILISLPVNSLLVFRSISKQWLSLVSDPRFQHDHVCRNTNPSTSGLYYSNYTAGSHHLGRCLPIPLLRGSYRSLPLLTFLKRKGPLLKLYHSFNGLILCSVHMVGDRMPRLIVCNPTTQRYKLIYAVDSFSCDLSIGLHLYFDSSISNHYKVIFVRQIPDSSKSIYDFGIYSSESESWKTIRLRAPPDSLLSQCHLVLPHQIPFSLNVI